MRAYFAYKAFAWADCFTRLRSGDVTISDSCVVINFPSRKNDQFHKGSQVSLAALDDSPYCPVVLFRTYFELMGYASAPGFLNCRILHAASTLRARPTTLLSPSAGSVDLTHILHSHGLDGFFTIKSFKVSGVSEGFRNGLPLEDVMLQGGWRSLETPLHYRQLTGQQAMTVSRAVV